MFRKGEKIKSSDLLKLCLIFYFCIFENRWQISSPGFDISALSMVLYISAKWCELCEEGCEDIQEYGVLCLLAVWIVTLKLSAAMIVLLVIYPGIQMIRSESWKRICRFLAAGMLLLLKTASFYGAIPWKRSVEYSYHETDQVELDGVTIYVPQPSDDMVGYQFFPSTQNAGVIERIELRTGSLEDGFRTREEYMQAEWK